MKILAFSAGVLLPVAIALMLGRSDPEPGVTEPQASVPATQAVQTAQPEPAAQAVLPEPEAETAAAVPAPTPQGAATGLSKPLGLYPLDIPGVEQAWENWIVQNNIKASAMALGFEGEILTTAGENRSSDAAYPLASLSKAITAMCLNVILAETHYSWGTRLSELAPALAQINMAPHDGAQALRLADLVTHTSGFPKNIDGNETAGEGRNLYTQQHFAREALTNPARQTGKRSFEYSNVNYAVLGQIITALTGETYGEACTARIMEPAGATSAVVGGRMWATAGFGGWSASAEDYARFVMHWLGPDKPWIRNPQSYAFDKKSGAGLGVFHIIERKSFTAHHTGLWRSKNEARRHGSIFVISETGATFVANWQGSLEPAAYKKLREAISPHLR